MDSSKIFDFQSYIQRREANPMRTTARLQNYAYIDDIEHQRELSQNGLVRQAVTLGLVAWQLAEGRRLKLKSCDICKVQADERIARAWNAVCCTFDHSSLSLKIIPNQKTLFESYGDHEGVFFGLSTQGSSLSTPALKFLFGSGMGALDNGHVPYLTLARFFDAMTRGLLEVAVQIPDALTHWRRSGRITEDRAGILSSRDLSAAMMAMMRMELDWDNAEIMREIRRYYEGLDVDWGTREIGWRVRSLEIFMKSAIYQGGRGLSMREVDAQVKSLFK